MFFTLSSRVVVVDRITHPAAVGRSVQPCPPTALGIGGQGSQGNGKKRAVRLGAVLALADNLPRTGWLSPGEPQHSARRGTALGSVGRRGAK